MTDHAANTIMTTTDPMEQIKVTQADREATAEYLTALVSMPSTARAGIDAALGPVKGEG